MKNVSKDMVKLVIGIKSCFSPFIEFEIKKKKSVGVRKNNVRMKIFFSLSRSSWTVCNICMGKETFKPEKFSFADGEMSRLSYNLCLSLSLSLSL